jgi:hypothetical protein
MVSMAVSDKFEEKWPELSRNTGAKILDLILEGPKGVRLDESFAGESLFCEWVYVLHLDNDQSEVYSGSNTKPVPKSNRFKCFEKKEDVGGLASKDRAYYAVKLIKKIPFELVTKREIRALEKEES